MRCLHRMLSESKINAQGYLELSGKIVTCDFLRAELEGNFKKDGGIRRRGPLSHAEFRVPHPITSEAVPSRRANPLWRIFFRGATPAATGAT